MRDELKPYIHLSKFLAEILGEHTEVVLHDLSNLENSIIAIENNLSGRTIGGPASNLVLQVLHINEDEKGDKSEYYANYEAHDSKGNPLRSSTYFIRDNMGEVTGALCINTNCTPLMAARDYLDSLIKVSEYAFPDTQKVTETLSTNAEDLTSETISRVIAATGITPERMSQDEKLDVIRQLDDKGIFLIKGTIASLAEILSMSESSVYRYLRESRKPKRVGVK